MCSGISHAMIPACSAPCHPVLRGSFANPFAISVPLLTSQYMTDGAWKRIAIGLAIMLVVVLICAGLVVADIVNWGFSLF